MDGRYQSNAGAITEEQLSGTIFNERSEPLAAYRAKIIPYNPFAFPPFMEVSVGCNPSRPTIFSPSRLCRFQNNISLKIARSYLISGFQA
jgi:hypothetical protein